MSPSKVLFAGNSYTFCNKLPWIVAKLAESAGENLIANMVVQGGVSLECHAHNQETLEAIDKGGWDIVVLQDFSLQVVDKIIKILNS